MTLQNINQGFTDIFIKRPVLATVLSLIILLVGIRAYFSLPVRLYPKVDATVVSVSVTYAGANAELMESFVASPVESAIASVDGLDYITSQSSQGKSVITAYFKLGTDINQAVSDVNSLVSSVKKKLPKDIDDPIVQKNDPNSFPVMIIGLTGNMSREAMSDYVMRTVQPKLQTVDGVASANVWGPQYAMRVWLDPAKMAAHGISPNDISAALSTNNLQSPGGRLDSNLQEFTVNPKTDLSTAEEFNRLIVKGDGDKSTRIEDIGKAELGASHNRVNVRFNGNSAVMIGVMTKSLANPLTVSKAINKIFPEIQRDLPAGMQAKIFWDSANYIDKSIAEVEHTIIEAAIFVILVVFLFLGSFRTLLIPVVTIPLSLVGVGAVMLAFGYSLNTLTLLALVLAIGMVVDDAIVVSENIHRHITAGETPFQAALIGANEIKFAVISMTLTLAAVYAPIGFMGGLTGALFKEFAFSLAAAVIISGFVALTLSPMMCSRVMTKDALTGRFSIFIHNATDKLAASYARLLSVTLKVRWGVFGLLILVLVGCYFLYLFLPQELAPKEDEGFIFTMVSAPTSANIDYMSKYTASLNKIYRSVPAIDSYIILNGIPSVSTSWSVVHLKPWEQRTLSVSQIIQRLMPQMMAIPGIRAFPVNPSNLPGSTSMMPVNFVLKTTGNYNELNQAMDKLLNAVRQNPGIVNAHSDLNYDQPQYNINIDRDKARSMGIPAQNIASALNIALSEPEVTRFSMGGRSYDVIPQLLSAYSKTPDALNNLYVHTASGALTSIANIVNITRSVEPQSLDHFQQMRGANLEASLAPGYTLGQALNYLQKTANEILPKNIQYDFYGTSRQFYEESGTMLITFLFAIIFIYLVLAAQFESFRDPLIVMFTVPLSTLGALAILHIIPNGSLNIYSEIGIVTLVGLISKHGILMVEFANQLREQGMELREAIIKAASVRLRPILMTTCAMILGALPLALATGAGALSRQQIGWTIVGGMAVGTLFTLFVIPTMYSFLAPKHYRETY